jgi:mRNA interferase RelE/StbE
MSEFGSWQVIFTRPAEKALRRLPRDLLARLAAVIDGLAADPHPPGSKKLTGYDNLYRLRVGDWRIIYAIEADRLVILVLEIGPRGQVYRDF